MRKHIVAGNWKMNKSPLEAQTLASEVAQMAALEAPADVHIVVCPPFLSIPLVGKLLNEKVQLGAQNCHPKDSGAYTGEVSVPMLKEAGVGYVILGHSERREYFGESNALIKEKVDQVLAKGLTPLFCCGETLEQRNQNIHIGFIQAQISESLFHLDAETIKKVVIAYEPIWAIGTGVTASTEQAQEMHATIRLYLASKYGAAVAAEISILYGGSCKPDNAKELFACADVDGGLIGGASLKARDFIDIVKSF
jgi:triosephosphate isomerase (TIM)